MTRHSVLYMMTSRRARASAELADLTRAHVTGADLALLERRAMSVPTAAPDVDRHCRPFPCRQWHGTYAHLSGESPCECPCHGDAAGSARRPAAWAEEEDEEEA